MKTIMLRLTSLFVLTAALLGTAPASSADGLRVWAQIDGRSRLVVKTNAIYWDHIIYTAPGLYNTNLPTLLNGYKWYPEWIQLPGLSHELSATTLFTSNSITINKLSGRGPVTTIQQPSVGNDFTLIVEFDDEVAYYEDYYEVILDGVVTMIAPSIDIQVSAVAVSWQTESNRLYQVQYCQVLDATNWFNLGGTILGNGGTTNITDSALGQPRRFYRVIPLP
jgi:hypothetical protein